MLNSIQSMKRRLKGLMIVDVEVTDKRMHALVDMGLYL